MRNADMVKLSGAHAVMVFWDGKSRGTANLMRQATRIRYMKVCVVRTKETTE